ncbi:MAG: DUF1800 domain-containing protein [Pseudomonadota bacterium]
MTLEHAIAANRFGLGARPGDLDRMGDPQDWLRGQITRAGKPDPVLRALGDSPTVINEIFELRRQRNEMRKAGKDMVNEYAKTVRKHYAAQVLARYQHAANTDAPFRERLVHFFTNHFAVSADKQPMPAIAGLFEQEAIRPNVTSKFADLLVAVEQHPAMLTYLDNQRSIGPGSRAGKAAARRAPERNLGLNENLAREILELHTLGVDGGYTQTDVTTFAKVITGWSVAADNDVRRNGADAVGAFFFRSRAHEPGTQNILGKRYPDSGVNQGVAVLRDLAVHPATARHLATKIARHFVSDVPPKALVERLETVWLDSDGDLGAVANALVNHDACWAEEKQKYKSPHEFVVSSFRALDYAPDEPQVLFAMLEQLGQAPYRPGSPAGWPDTADDWGSADALYKRIEWAGAVGDRAGTRAKPLPLARAVVGPSLSPSTIKALAGAESGGQGLALLLASPDFLRR